MGYSVYPVPSSGGETWTLISSSTPTSGTSVNFTSISGYRKLRLIYRNIMTTGDVTLWVRINGVTTGNEYTSTFLTLNNVFNTELASFIGMSSVSGQGYHTGFLEFPTANQSVLQTFTGYGTVYSVSGGALTNNATRLNINGTFSTPTTITSLSVSNGTFSGSNTGTIYLYGVTA